MKDVIFCVNSLTQETIELSECTQARLSQSRMGSESPIVIPDESWAIYTPIDIHQPSRGLHPSPDTTLTKAAPAAVASSSSSVAEKVAEILPDAFSANDLTFTDAHEVAGLKISASPTNVAPTGSTVATAQRGAAAAAAAAASSSSSNDLGTAANVNSGPSASDKQVTAVTESTVEAQASSFPIFLTVASNEKPDITAAPIKRSYAASAKATSSAGVGVRGATTSPPSKKLTAAKKEVAAATMSTNVLDDLSKLSSATPTSSSSSSSSSSSGGGTPQIQLPVNQVCESDESKITTTSATSTSFEDKSALPADSSHSNSKIHLPSAAAYVCGKFLRNNILCYLVALRQEFQGTYKVLVEESVMQIHCSDLLQAYEDMTKLQLSRPFYQLFHSENPPVSVQSQYFRKVGKVVRECRKVANLHDKFYLLKFENLLLSDSVWLSVNDAKIVCPRELKTFQVAVDVQLNVDTAFHYQEEDNRLSYQPGKIRTNFDSEVTGFQGTFMEKQLEKE